MDLPAGDGSDLSGIIVIHAGPRFLTAAFWPIRCQALNMMLYLMSLASYPRGEN